jgi:hypothetical protein
MIMQADSIIACAIAYALRKRPDLVQADILKLMRQKASLEAENQELRRLVGRDES